MLDLLTTLAFLAGGGAEANPVVRLAMAIAPSTLEALLGLKLLALVPGCFCFFTDRQRLLEVANVFFAALVVWNLVALILRSA